MWQRRDEFDSVKWRRAFLTQFLSKLEMVWASDCERSSTICLLFAGFDRVFKWNPRQRETFQINKSCVRFLIKSFELWQRKSVTMNFTASPKAENKKFPQRKLSTLYESQLVTFHSPPPIPNSMEALRTIFIQQKQIKHFKKSLTNKSKHFQP